jgi:septum site-determining protein MinC
MQSRRTFEVKSSQISLIAIILKEKDLNLISEDFLKCYGPGSENNDFFDFDGVILDFSLIELQNWESIHALINSIQQCRLIVTGIRGISNEYLGKASALGLIISPLGPTSSKLSALDNKVEIVQSEPISQTLVIDKPIRSGQKIYARGCDLVVLSMVNQGAEVIADGNIHVYAPLRGKAIAGARGNLNARIFSSCFEPELISIAGIYRTSENSFDAPILGKAVQVRLSNDGSEKLLIDRLKL